jgi:hypothetical protein
MGDDVMGEPDVIRLLGRGRFERLRAGGWLTNYARHYIEFRLREDKALHPEARRPPVVAKGYTAAGRGGAPEVVIDRDGMRHLVVRKAAAPAAARLITPELQAEFEGLLAAARRFLHARGISW